MVVKAKSASYLPQEHEASTLVEQGSEGANPIFLHFEEAAGSLIQSYSNLVDRGFPPSAVALAMLGATINTYKMFGLGGNLPDTLRALAEQLEAEQQEGASLKH